jgi:hypothetical protein
MARQGLHLQSVRCLRMIFVFQRGEPADVTYRIDFQLSRTDPSYIQLFNDAGWEHVDQMLGWQYWRAPTAEGRGPEIFTDVESQIKKYQRLLVLFALSWLPMLFLLPGNKTYKNETTAVILLLGVAAITLYAVVRLLLRIRKLRQQAP